MKPPRYDHWHFNCYRVAEPQWKLGINRIMGYRIGVYAVLGRYSIGICRPRSLLWQREHAARKLR